MIRRTLLPLLAMFALAATASGLAAQGKVAAAAPGPSRVPRLEDSPGWYPAVDPESASVKLGRRPNAPLVKMPFEGGGTSLDDLGRRICRVLERPHLDSMMKLTVTEKEFREILWPEFPQSRPATGLTWEDGWRVLYARLLNGSNSALYDHAGDIEFVAIESDTTVAYKNFKLHNGVVLVARNAAGELERLGWVRSVAERKGRFKIYSVRD
jgi:hypothetical protein